MQFTFTNISDTKFRINGYEMFKTFVSFKINDSQISVLNIFDSKYKLMPRMNVADIEVNGVTFANANSLITALNPVIYSPRCCGEVNQSQISQNTADIQSFQNAIQGISDEFNNYYDINQIDQLISELVFAKLQYDHGEIDGDNLLFKDDEGNTLLTIDIKELKNQGVKLSFDEHSSELSLKTIDGNVLSAVKIKAKETYYDNYIFVDGVSPILENFIPTENFSIIKITDDDYYFVAEEGTVRAGSRLFFNDLNEFVDLGVPETINGYNFWKLNTLDPENVNLISYEKYRFNVWLSSGSGSSFTGIKTSNTSDIEFSGDGTEGDPLKGVLTQSVKNDIAKGVTAYESGSPGETPTLQEVIDAGNTYEVKSIFGGVEGALTVLGFKFNQSSLRRSVSLLMTEQGNIEKYTVFTSEGVVYEHNGLREKTIAFPFGVRRQDQFSGEKIPYFPLSINGEFADEFGAVLIPETIIIPISTGNVRIREVFGHRFLRDSKLVGFELFCEDAPTGDSIGVNLLINDSTVGTVYIPDSETLSGESSREDNPLEVYRGDKVSFDVFGIGSTDPGTNLRGVLKVIENSGWSDCQINNLFSVYEDANLETWIIKMGVPQISLAIPVGVSWDFEITLFFDDSTSETINFNLRQTSKELSTDLSQKSITSAKLITGGVVYLFGVDENSYPSVEPTIELENDILADNITFVPGKFGNPDCELISFLIDTICEI